jgi:hypothetical protein
VFSGFEPSQKIPIFLFTVYGKSQKSNISTAEKGILKTIINEIINAYGESNHE